MVLSHSRQESRENRSPTGVLGLDELIEGGLPSGSLIVLAGRPGTGKTVLAARFLYEGSINGEPTIYVSFSEDRSQFIANMEKFGLDFNPLINSGKFNFVDLTTVSGNAISDALDLVLNQVSEMKAKRLVLDSFTSLAQGFDKIIDARIALHVILGKLVRREGCTTLILVEMPYGTQKIGMGIEEFVADGIIVLDSLSHKGGPLRTINIRKMRGTQIRLDTSTYSISAKEGFVVYPAAELSIEQGIGDKRIPTYIPSFDRLIQGGLLERSVSALTGAAGTGKTTFSLEFAYNGAKEEDGTSLFISYAESKGQLRLIAKTLGMDAVDDLIAEGKLTIEGILPEKHSIEAHVEKVRNLISQTNAKRIVFDDITGLQAICTDEEFYSLIRKLVNLAKSSGATSIVTMSTSELAGLSVTGMFLWTLLDAIILMRYVEIEGQMDRSIILLKMRGTRHDNLIRKFAIKSGGIEIEGRFTGYTGILSGSARKIATDYEQNESKVVSEEQDARTTRREEFEVKIKDAEPS